MNKVLISLLLTAALIGGFMLFKGTHKLEQAADDTRPSMFEYQDCQRTRKCSDMKCDPKDTDCNWGSWHYSNCMYTEQVCLDWATDFQNMSSDDKLTDNYYNCHKTCDQPKDKSATWYDIQSCDAQCGGIKTEQKVLSAPTGYNHTNVTMFNYQDCQRAQKCSDMKCDSKDSACNWASWHYSNCMYTDDACLKWATDFQTMSSDDLLTDNYYNCHFNCDQKKTDSPAFYAIQTCDGLCGGIQYPASSKLAGSISWEDVEINPPTQYEYQECDRALKCSDMECKQSDKACQAAGHAYGECEITVPVCQKWQEEFEFINGDDFLPEVYYQCQEACHPQPEDSESYWEIYECKATCSGIYFD